jgi:DNA-directed RNA polymerase I subunit RPA43
MSAESLAKKRKQGLPVDPSPSKKKPRKEAKLKEGKTEKKKLKGKEKAKADSAKEFTVVGASLVVSIPPVFASNPRAGVEEMLDSMVMRYITIYSYCTLC